MKKVIFLDVDGVLNNNCEDFVEECVSNVNKLASDNDADIVMITSLQGNGTTSKRNKLSASLKEVGINVFDYIDPNFEGELCGFSMPSRVLGIVDYLKKNSDVSYVILDDEFHNDYRMACLNYFKTRAWKGLQSKDLEKISFKEVNLKTLSYFNYRYRSLGAYEMASNRLILTLKKVLDEKKKSM